MQLLSNHSNPFIAGHQIDDSPNYICRAKNLNQGFQIGYATNVGILSQAVCWTSYKGVSKFTKDAEVLVDSMHDNLVWVRSDRKSIPLGAIIGGRSSSGEQLIITRCLSTSSNGEQVVPGYLSKSSPEIAYRLTKTSENVCESFEVLTCREHTSGCCNKLWALRYTNILTRNCCIST